MDEEQIESLVAEAEGGIAPAPPKQQSYFKRNVMLVGILCFFVSMFVMMADETVTQISDDGKDYAQAPMANRNPHQSSFGGINNLGHPGGAKAAAAGQGVIHEDIVIPVSNFGKATISLNPENLVNHVGHYRHDEHRSPYASHLYDKSKEELDEEQAKYVKQMEEVRKTWGAWSFQDDKPDRPGPDFSDVKYKDLPNDKFPAGSWQTDEEYISRFLKEANALVDRVTEGIYAEYGSPLKKADGTELTPEEVKDRNKRWGPRIVRAGETNNDPVGIGTMSQVALDGLVRKLLHSLLTNDEFYVVLGGHSAAAGHGNQFQQNSVLSFHHLMEPVFDKLGVRLMSRNMAMGGVGTLHYSLGGKDLYGEADFMEWDSAMTEKGPTVDLWNKQAILSGERVPVIFNQFHFEIEKETNGTAMMGMFGTVADESGFIPQTTDENEDQMPYAARWVNGEQEKYNAVCWVPRKDVTPFTPQAEHPGSQVGWHPGFRWHQFKGRKIALVILKGLKEALKLWEKGIEEDGFPLAEKYWHVGETYETIRETLRTHLNTPKTDGEDVRSACETVFTYLPRVCRVAMHGYGMWTPHVSAKYDFINLIHAAPNGYKPAYDKEKNWYTGFDLLPYNQKIPDGEVDVHAIAIATTFPPPDLDHDWVEDDEEAPTDGNSADPPDRRTAVQRTVSRRWLKEASEQGFRQKPNVLYAEVSKHADDATKKINKERPNEMSNKIERNLDEESIVPGRGWYAHGWRYLETFCDGSTMSECDRMKSSNCLALGANDNHREVTGNSLSGWLVFTLPRVKEGIILARMEWWCPKGDLIAQDWTEVNDGKTLDETPYNDTRSRHLWSEEYQFEDYGEPDYGRALGGFSIEKDVPQDLKMDVAINGKITKTWERDEWIVYTAEHSKNCAVWPLLDDESMATKEWKEGEEGEPVEVAIRYRSEINPHKGFCISHVYYA